MTTPKFSDDDHKERADRLRLAIVHLCEAELQSGGHPASVLVALQVAVADILVAFNIPVIVFAGRVTSTIEHGKAS